MEIFSNPLVAGGTSLAVAAALTYLVRELAHRYGFVAKPKSDRWHKRPTAMMGGAAIFVATLVMYAAVVPKSTESLIIMGASTFLFLVGLLDDLLNIKPYQKLIGQLIGAIVIVGLGPRLPLTGYEVIDIWITVFWLIGITTAERSDNPSATRRCDV